MGGSGTPTDATPLASAQSVKALQPEAGFEPGVHGGDNLPSVKVSKADSLNANAVTWLMLDLDLVKNSNLFSSIVGGSFTYGDLRFCRIILGSTFKENIFVKAVVSRSPSGTTYRYTHYVSGVELTDYMAPFNKTGVRYYEYNYII